MERRPGSSNLPHGAARLLAVMIGAVALIVVSAVQASADGAADQTLLLLLDASGSMKAKLPGGQTRIAAAQASLRRAIDTVPAETRVGMRVYGASVPDDKGKKAQCVDSELVVPVATGNLKELRAAVDAFAPLGETPIAYALAEAAGDLPADGNRTILLVSDGEETCNADPCDVAADLAGIYLRVDVIGVDVDTAARRQLSCIAKAGGGRYVDARCEKVLDSAPKEVRLRSAAARQHPCRAHWKPSKPVERLQFSARYLLPSCHGQSVNFVGPSSQIWPELRQRWNASSARLKPTSTRSQIAQ